MSASSREHRRAGTLWLKVSLAYSAAELHPTRDPGIGGRKYILPQVRAVIKDLLIVVRPTSTPELEISK